MSKATKQTEQLINGGLLLVRTLMEMGKIGNDRFNMQTFGEGHCSVEGYCGTPRCIGGWLGALLFDGPADPMDYLIEHDYEMTKSYEARLRNLFYPESIGFDWGLLTPKHGIKAIDNFLAGQKDPWKDVVSKMEQREFENATITLVL